MGLLAFLNHKNVIRSYTGGGGGGGGPDRVKIKGAPLIII